MRYVSQRFVGVLCLLAAGVVSSMGSGKAAAETGMSLNSEMTVVPAPGQVVVDGKTDDWDLSAGVWSYNTPTVVGKFSVWTHMMWDQKGVYFLARYNDLSPMQNAARGKDFANSWRADCYQARVIFDDRTADEHEMHVNLFYSTPESKPYMLVHHGGFGDPDTGPAREDQDKRLGADMAAAGGQIAFRAWDDKKGYNLEAFWPWKYVRTNGQPLTPGEQFTFGIEAMWGNGDGGNLVHRLADGIKDERVNRIFMFRARNGWGRAVIAQHGKLEISRKQEELLSQRLKRFVNYDTVGAIPIAYDLPDAREVTIAIDNSQGLRVRNLFGQYPRKAGGMKDLWDGLDDAGKPVSPGQYTATVVDHLPLEIKFFNSVYNAGTPPWVTESGRKLWGSNHGHPTTVRSHGEMLLVGFAGTEGAPGLLRADVQGNIQWVDNNEVADASLDQNYAYTLSMDSWIQQIVVRRLDLATGQSHPFDDENHSVQVILPVPFASAGLGSSIAVAQGKVFVLLRCKGGDRLYRIDPRTGKIELDKEAGKIIALTDRDEVVYGLLADGAVVKLGAQGQETARLFVAGGLAKPVRLAISQDKKRVAISDAGANQVFVYDASGKALQTVGAPYQAAEGMRPAGKFIETNLIAPLGLDFDHQGQLWVAEAQGTCRRVTRWSEQGQLLKSFWGGADYGAMSGFAMTFDSTRFIAHGLEFQLDLKPDPWQRPTAEKPLAFHPALALDRGFVYRYQGHEYAVTTPGNNGGSGFFIAKRDADGVFRPCVRVNLARATAWIDRNGNGKEDAGEVTSGLPDRAAYWSTGWIRPDLTIITNTMNIYSPTGVSKEGVPLYDFAKPQAVKNPVKIDMAAQGSTGTVVMDMAGNVSDGIRFHTAAGRQGAYPNRYQRHDAPAAQRGVLIAPFRTNGVVENVPGVGSITALGGDRGEWFLMSMDGLFLSSLLQDAKGDTTLDETFVGQESFGGFFWRDEQGRVLAQLGGASYRLMQIHGLETVRKQQLSLTVTQSQIEEGSRLIAAAAQAQTPQEPTELRITRVAKLPAEPVAPELDVQQPLVDGAPNLQVEERGNPARWWRAAMVHDGKDLAIMYQVADPNPWKNAANRFTHAFIGGDCVDLKLQVPGRGAMRLLVAPLNGQDTAVFFQQHAAQKDNPTTYVVGNNPANAQAFDVVRRCPSAKITHKTGMSGYSVLVTVPLTELGLDPSKPDGITGLLGVIYSDPSGTNRAARLYWLDKQTDLVSDVPSEARLDPAHWGKVVLQP